MHSSYYYRQLHTPDSLTGTLAEWPRVSLRLRSTPERGAPPRRHSGTRVLRYPRYSRESCIRVPALGFVSDSQIRRPPSTQIVLAYEYMPAYQMVPNGPNPTQPASTLQPHAFVLVNLHQHRAGARDPGACGSLLGRPPRASSRNVEGHTAPSKLSGNPLSRDLLRGYTEGLDYDSGSFSQSLERRRVWGKVLGGLQREPLMAFPAHRKAQAGGMIAGWYSWIPRGCASRCPKPHLELPATAWGLMGRAGRPDRQFVNCWDGVSSGTILVAPV